MNDKRIVAVFFFLAIVLATLPAGANAPQSYSQTFTFGVVPQQAGNKLSKLWSPILKYLEEKTGYGIRFATARNIPTFEKRLAKGKYDFAYMNPYHYTHFHDQAGYAAFAKAKNKRLKGILVVRKDSQFRDMNDLDGEELAFPSNAFAANLVPRALFEDAGLDVSANFVSSHDAVYRNVAKGRYPAGGGVMRTFKNASPEFRNQLRILWKTEGYTPHAFASHPRVPQAAVQRIMKVMLEMEQDPVGRKLLKSIRLKGIEPGQDHEWDDVRALNIN